VVVVATGNGVTEVTNMFTWWVGPPLAAFGAAPAPSTGAELKAGPTTAPPPATELVPPDAPPAVPPEGDGKLGTFAGVVGCAVVRGMLTGPLPITRAATIDTAAATALTDAMLRSRTCCIRLVRGTAAAIAMGAPNTSGGGNRPKSGEANTSSRVA
jgi:hypothetical protein